MRSRPTDASARSIEIPRASSACKTAVTYEPIEVALVGLATDFVKRCGSARYRERECYFECQPFGNSPGAACRPTLQRGEQPLGQVVTSLLHRVRIGVERIKPC